MISPNDAVRSELRDALRQLADLLRRGREPDYIRLTDAVLHTWALFRLAQLEDGTRTLLEEQLEGLSQDLNADARLDTEYHAQQLRETADRV